MTRADEHHPALADLGGLLFAALLAETYFILMIYLIQWYGDLPDQAEFFLRRTRHNWVWLEAAGAVIGSFAPLIALLSRVRNSARPLRAVSVAGLLGVFIENTWLVAPVSGKWSAPFGALAVIAIGGLTLGFGDIVSTALHRRAAAHGV